MSAAIEHARASAARDARADGTAWTVEANIDGSEWTWSGAPYDALGFAKDMVFNGYEATLTTDTGRVLDADAIEAARY